MRLDRIVRRAFVPALFSLALALPALASTPRATASVTCDKITVTAAADNLPLNTTFAWRWNIVVQTTNGPVALQGDRPFSAGGFSSFTEMFDIPTSLTGTVTGISGTISLVEDGVVCGICGPIAVGFNTALPLTCGGGGGGGGTGCPATIGYWKNSAKHPFPAAVQANGLTIGGTAYTAAQLLEILNGNGGNAVAILGRQLVGARLNLAAGAKQSAAANAAITAAEALLSVNNLNLLTSSVAPSTTVGQALIAQASILDAYNNGYFGTCVHGQGLVRP